MSSAVVDNSSGEVVMTAAMEPPRFVTVASLQIPVPVIVAFPDDGCIVTFNVLPGSCTHTA